MINPLTCATNGYLTNFTIRTLEVGVDGYLIETITPHRGNDAGGGDIFPQKRKDPIMQVSNRRQKIIKANNDIIVAVMKAFLNSEN